jgi:hypothetical protein
MPVKREFIRSHSTIAAATSASVNVCPFEVIDLLLGPLRDRNATANAQISIEHLRQF